MTQKRQTGLQLTLLAIAMAALVALSAAGPAACTPATPSEQASGQAEAEDATTTTDATNTPTPEPTATTAATSTPTPTATVATANSKLEPMLNALVTQSQSAGAQGAAGQTTRMVEVVIDPVGATQNVFLANSGAIDRLVTGNGGTNMGTGEYLFPVSLLPQLASHSAVASVTAAWPENFPYPKLSRALNNAVAVWQAGATPQQAAAAYSALVYNDKILVFLDVSDSAAFNRVEAFFTTNKVYVAPERRESDLATLSMMVLVPIPLLASLSQVSGITEIEDAGLEPISVGVSRSPEFREYLNLYLYGTLPPNLRSQLSPLPTEVWELEGITPTPTTAPTSTPTPAPSSGRVGDNPQLPTLNRVVMVKNRPAPDDDGSAFASLLIRPGLR